MTFLADKPVFSDASRQLRLLPDEENFDARIERSKDGRRYAVAYEPDTAIAEKLTEFLTPPPEKGTRVFNAYADNNTLRIEIIKNKGVEKISGKSTTHYHS